MFPIYHYKDRINMKWIQWIQSIQKSWLKVVISVLGPYKFKWMKCLLCKQLIPLA
jgi:hypothetical protein